MGSSLCTRTHNIKPVTVASWQHMTTNSLQHHLTPDLRTWGIRFRHQRIFLLGRAMWKVGKFRSTRWRSLKTSSSTASANTARQSARTTSGCPATPSVFSRAPWSKPIKTQRETTSIASTIQCIRFSLTRSRWGEKSWPSLSTSAMPTGRRQTSWSEKVTIRWSSP